MSIRTLVEHRVSGEKLLAKVREIVHEGNVRRIIIKNHDDVTIMELPLTVGVVGAVMLPMWVAIGAIAALAADYRLAVEKISETEKSSEVEESPEPTAAGTIGEPW